MSDIKILLVDDHAVVRMGFKMLIEAEPDMTVIAEAESGSASISILKPILTTAWSSTNNILISLIAIPFPI